MNQLPYERPTEHYDEKLETIDEQICDLIKQRKDLSSNTPSLPTKQLLSNWSKKYDLYEEFLVSVFSHFLNEEWYRPVVEPTGFLKNIPILKSFEKDHKFYTVTFIRQFKNASVVHFTIDRDDSEDDEMSRRFRDPNLFDLEIVGKEVDYDCRNEGGGGSGGHESFTYIISPALPDDLVDYKLVFKQCKIPFNIPTGFEFVIELNK